jgi:serine/threonine protein kinase
MRAMNYDGWTPIGDAIGKGGQGEVWKARSPTANARFAELMGTLENAVKGMVAVGMDPQRHTLSLANAFVALAKMDGAGDIGALKVFAIPSTASEHGKKAIARLGREIEALKAVQHPNVLRLLHANADRHFMVTEYYDDGPLSKTTCFKGNARASLEAFHGLVSGVAALHGAGYVHRDIKPANIFLASDGHLVLGDFGITFFADEAQTRLTDYIGEKVGTHDWMAPWSWTGGRLDVDSIKPNFDVFALGKVLWCMLTGDAMLPLWYHKEPGYRLSERFPDTRHIPLVQLILDQTVVEREAACLKSASELVRLVDAALQIIRNEGDLLVDGRQCHVCGKGTYTLMPAAHDQNDRVLSLPARTASQDVFNGQYRTLAQLFDASAPGFHALGVRAYRCDRCGHIQLFHCPDGMAMPAWRWGS